MRDVRTIDMAVSLDSKYTAVHCSCDLEKTPKRTHLL